MKTDPNDNVGDSKAERREQKQVNEKRFRPDNRRSIRIIALLGVRPKPQKGSKR